MINPCPDQDTITSRTASDHLAALYGLAKQIDAHTAALKVRYALGDMPNVSSQPTICRLETAAQNLRNLFP